MRSVVASDFGMTMRLRGDISILIPETDLAPGYLARFDADALMGGEFLLLNERHLVCPSSWSEPSASHLWNFNLHYFEYAIALGALYREGRDARYYERFKHLIESWVRTCCYPKGDGWHPYTISLRLVNWLVCRDLFRDEIKNDLSFDSLMIESMYLQYRHLLVNQERHLLANHYFENLKTLVIFSKLFGEDKTFKEVWRGFADQLEEQILPDGVHFERSLMYHKLVLEGILRVAFVLKQTDGVVPGILLEKAQIMLDAMASLEKGMGKTPFFNDSADGVAKECGQLLEACHAVLGLEADDSKVVFRDAGYYKLYDGDIAIMFDAGEPGPAYMLGHAHCDCLSFELSCKGRPVIVNSGTYAYQSDLRPYFRSTAAHNTAMIEGEEQLECWGEHRVAGRYRLIGSTCTGGRVEAAIKLPNGHIHRRCVELAGREFRIEDLIDADTTIVSRVHLLRSDLVDVVSAESCSAESFLADYSPELGTLSKILCFAVKGETSTSYVLRF